MPLPESFQSLSFQPWLSWVRIFSKFCGRTGGGEWCKGRWRLRGREQLPLPNSFSLLIKSGSFWGLKNYFCTAFVQLPVLPDLGPEFRSSVPPELSRDFVPDGPRDHRSAWLEKVFAVHSTFFSLVISVKLNLDFFFFYPENVLASSVSSLDETSFRWKCFN